MSVFRIAMKSLRHRRGTAILTAVAIGVSVMLLLGVERIRSQTRESFANSISGTDLIVGARGHPIQILLVSVFHIGYPTNNIRWDSFQEIRSNRAVAWAVPLSLGDSHRGFRVVGTENDLFEHFRYGRRKPLAFAAGGPFVSDSDAVIGAEIADQLNYQPGTEFHVGHGLGDVSFVEHKDNPFKVVGVLERTGTPVDRAIYVPLAGYDKMHEGFFAEPSEGGSLDPLADRSEKSSNRKISAALFGLNSRQEALGMQRLVNEYEGEPLTGIMPAVTIQELWQVTSLAERSLVIVSGFVVVVGLFGMVTNLLTGLNERRREMAVLRSVGASPSHVFGLLIGEATILTLSGIALGLILFYGVLMFVAPGMEARTGLQVPVTALSATEWSRLAIVLAAGMVIGVIPAYRVYRQSLADGLSIRL